MVLKNTKSKVHEGGIDKLDFIKIKNFCSVKDIVKRMKRLITDWEKIFTEDISHERLLFKIYKELLKLNNKKTINSFNN